MATVDTLLVRIDADLSSLKRELDKAATATSDASKKMGDSAKHAETSFTSLGNVLKGVATIAVARQLLSIGVAAIKAGGDIKDLADQVGLSTDAFQELSYAAAQFGVSQEGLNASLGIFSRNIGQAANGSDEMIAKLRDMGVYILDENKQLKSNEEILNLVVDAISKMPDAARQAAVGAEWFGRSFRQLLPLFKDGKQGLDDFRKAARDTGAVLSKEDVEALDTVGDKFTALTKTVDVLTQKLMAGLSPALIRIADNLRMLFGGATDDEKLEQMVLRTIELQKILNEPEMRGAGAANQQQRKAAAAAELKQLDDMIAANRQLLQVKKGLDPNGDKIKPEAGQSGDGKGFNPQGDKIKSIMDELALRKQLANVQMDWTLKTDEAIAARDREVAVINAHNAGIKAGLADKSAELKQYEATTMAIYDNAAAQEKMIAAQKTWDEIDKKAIEDAKKSTEELNKRRQAKEEAIRTGELEADQSDLLVAALRIGTKEYEQQRIELELLNRAKKSGLDLTDEEVARIKTVAKRTGENTDEMKRLNDQYEEGRRAATDFTNVIGKGMEDAIISGKDLRGVMQGMAEDILRIFLRLQVTVPLQQQMMSMMGYNADGSQSSGGGGGGLLGGLVKGVLGMFSGGGSMGGEGFASSAGAGSALASVDYPAFASGGDPPVGKASIVGENGPELFLPKTPGTIISNDNMKGMGGGTYYIDARGADNAGIMQLQKTIKELNGSIERRSVNAVMDHKRRNPAGFAA